MTHRFSDLGTKLATVVALVLVFIAMDGRWFVGIPARAETVLPASSPPPRKSSPDDRPRAPGAAATSSATPPRSSSTSTPARASPSGAASPSGGASSPPGSAGCVARGGRRELAGTLDLNTATAEQLTMLPGIGPAKAERILAWRRKHGPFRRTADIRRVSGFGFKTFKRLEAYLAITGPTTLTGG